MNEEYSILLAPDSFKGSLRSVDVCRYLRKGLEQSGFPFVVHELPLSDGGEGLVYSLVNALGGEYCTTQVHDPLSRPIIARYGLIDNGYTAIIEMAAASGLELLAPSEYDPLVTTTRGTGEMILDALDRGCRKLIIGIGGSATNDGGAGMLQALGVRMLDQEGAIVREIGGGSLSGIHTLDFQKIDPRLRHSEILVACDVTNPLTGRRGATLTYGKQKGASPADLEVLEEGMLHWGRLLEAVSGRAIIKIPGSGAAGGLGAGFLLFPQVVLRSGFDIIREATRLESLIDQADLVITGEGKVDEQTLYGKVVSGVGSIAKKYGKPVICVAGTLGPQNQILLEQGISAMFSIVNQPMTLDDAISQTPQLLQETGKNIGSLFASIRRGFHHAKTARKAES